MGGEPAGASDLEIYRTCGSARCVFMNGLGAGRTGTNRVWFAAKDPPAAHGGGAAGLRAFDAFPMTHHVECVATLLRDPA